MTIDDFYPVGSFYETSISEFDPSDAFGGTWERDTDMNTNMSTSGATGSTGGSNTTTLTVDQMPSHRHSCNIPVIKPGSATGDYANTNMSSYWNRVGAFPESTSYDYGYGATTWDNRGSSQPHNNMQPYITVYRWRRTA